MHPPRVEQPASALGENAVVETENTTIPKLRVKAPTSKDLMVVS
jgi:hypothetical protein